MSFFRSLVLCSLLVAGEAQAKRVLDLSAFSDSTQEEVQKQFPQFEKSDWTFADLDLLLQFLSQKGEFESLKVITDPEERPDHYSVSLGRIRRLGAINFVGGDAFSEGILRVEFGVSPRERFDFQKLRDGAEKVQRLYENNGYRSSLVNIEVPEGPYQEVDINVRIMEGPQTQLHSFNVSAANPTFKASVLKFLGRSKGKPYTPRNVADLQRDLRAHLSKQSYYAAIVNEPVATISENGKDATLNYYFDRTEEYVIELDGARKIPKSKLFSELDLTNFSSANPNLAGEISTRLREFYVSKGYARAEVSATEKRQDDYFRRTLSLKISEGPRVRIRGIELQGNFSQPEQYYKEFINEHASEVIQEGYYVKEDFEDAIQNLVNDRLNNGYLRAKVVSSRFIYGKERDSITAIINLEEGPLTIIEEVAFSGAQSFGLEELREVVGLQPGQPLKLNDLETSISSLRKHYLQKGYLEFGLLNESEDLVNYNSDNTKAQVHYRIVEGPQIFVGSIIVDGNTITRNEVIMKELEFDVGNLLTPEVIEESISRLQRTGHFTKIEIKTLEERTRISRRTVIVRVVDRDPGLLSIGAGVNNELGLTVRGYFSGGYRNLQGEGRALSARVDANYNVTDLKFPEHKLTLGYLEPYLFNSRLKGRVNVTRQTRVSDLTPETFDDQTFRTASQINEGTGSFEQDITSHWTLYWDVLTIATFRDFRFNEDGVEDDRYNQGLQNVTIGSTAIASEWDFRNHPFIPTQGHFSRMSIEYGSPAFASTGTIEFLRSQASFTHYLPVWEKRQWSWANSYRIGLLQNLSTKPDGAVPYDKKGFSLGGTSTVRGFSSREAFLRKTDFERDDGINGINYLLKGQAISHLFKTELRIPIYESFGTALFADYGSVQVSDSVLIPSQSRWSAGLAARYITPVGALSLEYAWKLGLDPRRAETPGALHVSFGTF